MASRSVRIFRSVSFLLILSHCLAVPLVSLPHLRNGIHSENFTLFSIVDGAGYSMHNTGFSLDLAMQTNPPVDGESLSSVTLEHFSNGRNQKWGTTFYGLPNEVEVSNGQFGKNFVSVYYPSGSSRDKARLYKFETLSPNHYKIFNLETKLCLTAVQREPIDPIAVEFGSCTEGNYTWLLRRTG